MTCSSSTAGPSRSSSTPSPSSSSPSSSSPVVQLVVVVVVRGLQHLPPVARQLVRRELAHRQLVRRLVLRPPYPLPPLGRRYLVAPGAGNQGEMAPWSERYYAHRAIDEPQTLELPAPGNLAA